MLDETDDLQYAVAQVLTEVTGSPEWHEGAALTVKEALGEEATSSPLALVEAAARKGLLSAVRAVMDVKHADHDQSSHGNWARAPIMDLLREAARSGERVLTDDVGFERVSMDEADEVAARNVALADGPRRRQVVSPDDTLWTQQRDVSAKRVVEIIEDFAGATAGHNSFAGPKSDLPIAIEHPDGRLVLVNGHHRVVAKRASGRSVEIEVIEPETKHGGPGPHDSGTPQAVHGSWAERLGRMIGLPDDLIDAEPDAGQRLSPDDPEAVTVEGKTDFIQKLVMDFLPVPDPVTFDMSFAKEALEDDDHPLHKIAAKAAHLLWGTREDETEDLDVVDEGFEDLYSAFDEFDEEMGDILDDLGMEGIPDNETYANMDHEVREEYTQRVSDAVDGVHSAYLDFASGFPEHAIYEAESRDGVNAQDAVLWAARSDYSISKVPYDRHEYAETLARSEAAARELKHATALGLAKHLTDEQGEILREGYHGNQFRNSSNGPAYAGASAAVGAWAQSSNDEHAPALFMQEGAAAEFGLHGWAGWHTQTDMAQGWDAVERAGVEEFADAQRTVLHAMYERTQQHFKEMGITHLRLHRGQAGWDGTDRPMSSWSMSDETARGFSKGGSPMEVDHDTGVPTNVDLTSGSILRHRTVPVEQVLCFPGTGFGCLSEYEVVVLANPPHEEAPGEDQLRFEGSEEWKHADHDQSTHGNWARGLLPGWEAVRDAVGVWVRDHRDDEPLPGRLERTFDPEPEYKRRTGPFVHEASRGFRQDVADRVGRIKGEGRVQRLVERTGVEMPPVVAAKHWDPERMDEFDPHRYPAPVGHTEFEGGLILLYEDMVERTQSPPYEDWDPDAIDPTADGTDTLVSGGLDAAIRHEFGHSLWYAKVKDRHPDWERFYDQGVGVEGKGVFREWTTARRLYWEARLADADRVREAGGSVAEREAAFRKAMNRYASTSMSEAFAEQVSYLLDPRFDPDNFTPEGLDLLRITARLLDADPGEFGL